MPMQLLLTGFEPFDGYTVNPSAELAKSLNKKTIGKFYITGVVLSLNYETLLNEVQSHIDRVRPEIILACGQAKRGGITIERIAVNACSTFRRDNYGHVPETDTIIEGAPAGYFTSIDPHPLVKAVQGAGIPAEVSYHAGTFGCNWLLFNIMHWINTGMLNSKAIFVHVPPLPVQAIEKHSTSLPTMSLETTQQALQIIIENL